MRPGHKLQRNEHVRASTKSWTRICRELRVLGISVGARAECFAATACTHPHRRESRRAQLRRDNDGVGQLQLLRPRVAG